MGGLNRRWEDLATVVRHQADEIQVMLTYSVLFMGRNPVRLGNESPPTSRTRFASFIEALIKTPVSILLLILLVSAGFSTHAFSQTYTTRFEESFTARGLGPSSRVQANVAGETP